MDTHRRRDTSLRDGADGPPVLVGLPGTLCPPMIFDRVAAILGGTVRVEPLSWPELAGPWDIPSIARQLVRRLRARGRPVLLCGHSTGGAIALRTALDAPELIEGLLLVDTGAHTHRHPDVESIIARVDADWGADLHAAMLDRSIRDLAPDDRTRFLAWCARIRREAVLDVLRSQRALDFRADLPGIGVPTTVVHGRHDRVRTLADATELAEGIPAAHLRIVDAAHTPVYEAPDAVAQAVAELASRTGRTGSDHE